MRSRMLFVLAGVLALGLIASGCGGGGSGSGSEAPTPADTVAGGPTPTKAEFIKKADAICTKGNEVLDKAAHEQLGKKADKDAATAYVTDTLIPSLQGQFDDIAALGAPKGDEAQVNALLSAAESDLNKLKQDPFAAFKGHSFTHVDAVAGKYGLTVCGNGG